MLQIFFVVGEAFVPWPLIDHVTSETHVAEANIHTLQVCLQCSFNPRVVLHTIRQTIAENCNDVTFLKLERFSFCS